eukprot:CAMPEP_0118710168 /NCGR_PEP_ID=MMETSP0800-20121206/23181_1 /TAXON_ID=210618 ORGANISM="Striatella unipunctata, Strain CCMP2910" /NCGR_SAMPLE_ID=MMETSP0800 /ASSEMBLY_ACC=CAM_ASM_000638 /LENGTH=217 /DNA_ID=CAMNT_0006614219 /DNA_START=104 /DNA_END=757 /DNA_ORIENTATION=+
MAATESRSSPASSLCVTTDLVNETAAALCLNMLSKPRAAQPEQQRPLSNYNDFGAATPEDLLTREERLNTMLGFPNSNMMIEKRRGVTVPFPMILYYMLMHVSKEGFEEVVSWQPHGRCFVVHKPRKFAEEILPRYFKQRQYPSFQRQLNLYGFSRLSFGRDKGGYYHELFLRGKFFLCQRITRTKIKGTGVRKASVPEKEPNFYNMTPVVPVDHLF